MPVPEMNALQLTAFWIWYHTASDSRTHERSFDAAAKRFGADDRQLRGWAQKFGWSDLARDEDQKLAREMERVIKAEIIDTFEQAIRRQKEIAGELYARFRAAIETEELELKVADLLKLMEFETNFIFGEQRGLPQNNFLTTVLGMMPPEKRTEFYGALERARDAGILTGPGVESARRN